MVKFLAIPTADGAGLANAKVVEGALPVNLTGLTDGVAYSVYRLSDTAAAATPAPGTGTPAISGMTGAASTTAGTSFTFTATIPAGTVIVAVTGRNSGTLTFSGLTVNGVAATLLGYANLTAGNSGTAFYAVTGASAGSATIVATFATSVTRAGITAWGVSGVSLAAPVVQSDVSGPTSGNYSPTVAVAAPGAGLILATATSVGATSLTWSGEVTMRRAWTNYGDTFGTSEADAIVTSAGNKVVTFTDDGNTARNRMLATLFLQAA